LRPYLFLGGVAVTCACGALLGCGSSGEGPSGDGGVRPTSDGGSHPNDASPGHNDGAADDDSGNVGDAVSDAGPPATDGAFAPYPPFDGGPIAPVIAAAPTDDWQASNNAALLAFGPMYSTSGGQWTSGPSWSFANDVEAVETSFLLSGGQNFLDMVVATYDLNDSQQFIFVDGVENGYDDEAWWAHAWIRAYDLTANPAYLAVAKTIFTDMTGAWDTVVCGGGVWWNRAKTYKNAVTNELFLLVAASLHNRTAGDTGPGSYLDWAQKEWAWFQGSGMIGGSGLINDGLTPGDDAAVCTNNGQTTWTYNQGVVLGGLAELYEATGDATLLASAEPIADAALAKLTDANGILQEPCGSGCDGDQISFKGIFVRNLVRLYDHDRKPSYYNFIVANARSLWANDRDGNNEFDNNWAGPFAVTSAPTQDSAMFALSAFADPISPASLFLRPPAHPSFNHAIGERDSTLGWACDSASCPAPGTMQSGPYVWYLPLGAHAAHLRASVDATSSRTDTLATFQVVDHASGTVLGSQAMAWSDFVEDNIPQEVTVPYTQATAGDPVEYQVTWAAASGGPRLVLTDVSVDGEQSFSGANLMHECGRLDGAWQWSVDTFGDTQPCLATNGPGFILPDGDYLASFELRVTEFALDDALVATLSVVDHDLGTAVGTLAVTRSQFATARFQTFAVPFHAVAGHHWDLQTQWAAAPTAPRMTIRGVYVQHAVTESAVTLPFNQRGMGTAPGDGSIDGVSSLDLGLLGPTLTIGNDTFTLGQAGNNVLQGGGGSVPVSAGSYASLELLGFAIDGIQASQGFTLTYADTTSQTVMQSLSDWTSATPQTGEQIALALPYRWSTTAKEYGNFHLFRYSIPVDNTRMLSGFTLPSNADVKIFGATLVSASQ
jgi:predicted alpha-1,6-mannanase (GH76 family)